MERKITIDIKGNEKLFSLLQERGAEVERGRNIQKEIEAMQEEQRKIGLNLNNLKEKVRKIISKKKIDLNEFEVLTDISLEDGEIRLLIVDALEEWKKLYLERNKK